jgi:polyisoprenoid-binding protein YceI
MRDALLLEQLYFQGTILLALSICFAWSDLRYSLCSMSLSTIGASALQGQLEGDEAFAEKRIPGSKHACVYEVAFLEAVEKLEVGKDDPIVVYGLNDDFGASKLAVERLQSAGYANSTALDGGLDAWFSAGFSVEGEGEASSRVPDGRYQIDLEKSVFRWTGRNLFNQHNGRIALSEGFLETQHGHLSGGSVTLDMTKMSCSDIKDEKMAGYLIDHLESDDFFSVADHPTAGFELSDVQPLDVVGPGDSNLVVLGSMQLRGKKKALEFKAQEVFLGGQYGLQGRFKINRTRFGSVYGSGKFFEKLGQHVVNDKVTVSFQLICQVGAES